MAAYQGRNASYQRRQTAGSRSRYYTYADGNTIRKVDYDVVRELQKEPVRRVSKEAVRNREKAAHMNVATVIFYTAFMAVVAATLFFYIQLQSANTAAVEQIAAMETQLNEMKLENEEEYSRIMGSVDMEQIKTRAIEDLGMQYAEEGQVIEVPSATDDYVRQYMDMP